jgi:hypothetical protein
LTALSNLYHGERSGSLLQALAPDAAAMDKQANFGKKWLEKDKIC